MIELFDANMRMENRQSSKGNQQKWLKEGVWYKADYTGYEGLAECVISHLLQKSSLSKEEYVLYDTELIHYKAAQFRGCKSADFLPEGWNLITLERLFQNMYGQSLNKSIYKIQSYETRLEFIVNQTIRMTGLENFGAYMGKLLTIDALFLNEDRHTHNIAVLMDEVGGFHYCPFFDHGAALLSDVTMDYPMSRNLEEAMNDVEAKTFCRSFEEQMEIAEKLYGINLRFHFTTNDVERLLEQEPHYTIEEKTRVWQILAWQMRKYKYLFEKN
ncbi:MAG: hypothetical protein IJ024_04130 [Lachnospiraceae bacterium]|nr:hypothetical protein [Lachnospiraceae bacterium]